MSSPITTHVLDTAAGTPAEGISVVLEKETADGWSQIGVGTTDSDGRVSDLMTDDTAQAGTYRLTFAVGGYFESRRTAAFYSIVPIIFTLAADEAHVHVPLLLAPHGYSTYRGS